MLVWAAGEDWAPDYPLALYRAAGGRVLDTAGPQAKVVEDRIAGRPGSGVALADGSFGAGVGPGSDYSSGRPGVYDQAYSYPSAESLRWLASRGVHSVRLAFMWERVQSQPAGPLVGREVERLRRVLRDAAAAGLTVLLDLHSYGRFAAGGAGGSRDVLELGSARLPPEALAQVWRELAGALGDEPALAGYGLTNEPHDLPGGIGSWQRASQLAVDAIREVDLTTPVYVAGYAYSGAARWQDEHDAPWISDPSGSVVYEAHQYFDADHTGSYGRSYDDEVAAAEAQGWTACGRTP